MKTMLQLVTLSVLLPCGATLAQAVSETYAYEGTNVYVYMIYESDLERNPRWDPAGSPPPLTISNAVQIAKTWLEAYAPHLRDWPIKEIKLGKHYGPSSGQPGWFYSVGFSAEGVRAGEGGEFFVIVLMDGAVPEVRRRSRGSASILVDSCDGIASISFAIRYFCWGKWQED